MTSRWTERSVFHFTTLDHLPAILQYGLLAINEQRRRGLPVRAIAGPPVIAHRSKTVVPAEPGGTLLDYVPFYFSNLTHMLLIVISNKVVDEQRVLHIEMPLTLLDRYPAVFTDGPTIPGSEPSFFTDPTDLQKLNWQAIDMPAWQQSAISLRSPRLAELLVHRHVPIHEATRIIVWDNETADTVRRLFDQNGVRPPRIETDSAFYFFDPSTDEPVPPIVGPSQIRADTIQTIETILQVRRQSSRGRFATLTALRTALRENLNAIPETAELIGLKTDNRVHFEDVGAHTLRVVRELRESEEFAELSQTDQVLLEVATFLHDIGKGPKSRWQSNGGKQQIDMNHPVKALPMLRRILTEEVQEIDPEQISVLCRLVVYHDLVGGILVSGRRIEELFSVFHTERELQMLFILARADSVAINPDWEHPELREQLKQDILQAMRQNQQV